MDTKAVVLNPRQKIISHVIYGVLIGIQSLIFIAFLFGLVRVGGRDLNPITAIYYVISIVQIGQMNVISCLLQVAVGTTYVIIMIQMIIKFIKCIVYACNKKIGYRRVGVQETFRESYAYSVALMFLSSTFLPTKMTVIGYLVMFVPAIFLMEGSVGELYCQPKLPSVGHVVSKCVNAVLKLGVIYLLSQFIFSNYWSDLVTSLLMLFATFTMEGASIGLIFNMLAKLAVVILYMVAGYMLVSTTFKTISDPFLTGYQSKKSFSWPGIMGIVIAIVAIDFVSVIFMSFLNDTHATIDIGPKFMLWFETIKYSLLPMLLLSIAGFISTKLYDFPFVSTKKIFALNTKLSKEIEMEEEVSNTEPDEVEEEKETSQEVVEVTDEKVEEENTQPQEEKIEVEPTVSVEKPANKDKEDSIEKLLKLKAMLDQGLITEEEFNKLKQDIII